MKFEYFENLTEGEAQEFLRQFLSLESTNFKDLRKQCELDGLTVDFSIKSVAPLLRWVVPRLKTIPQQPDLTLPAWIRNTDSYARNLFDFDEASKSLTLRAAYYLGESFVRSREELFWTTGNVETAETNMPVVAGFMSKLEMAPILIAENLLRRVTAEPAKMGDIEIAVEHWRHRAATNQ